jgi:hypothetical protein
VRTPSLQAGGELADNHDVAETERMELPMHVSARGMAWPAFAGVGLTCVIIGLLMTAGSSAIVGVALMGGGCAWISGAYRRYIDSVRFDTRSVITTRDTIALVDVQTVLARRVGRFGHVVVVTGRTGSTHRMHLGAVRRFDADRIAMIVAGHTRQAVDARRARTVMARRVSGEEEQARRHALWDQEIVPAPEPTRR